MPSFLTWDPTRGGIDFTYQTKTSKPLAEALSVAFYWADGTSIAGEIKAIPHSQVDIPAGSVLDKHPFTYGFNGANLLNAPLQTTDILAVVGNPNARGFNPATQVFALKDVQVALSNPDLHPSAFTLEVLKGLLRESGQGLAPAVITGTALAHQIQTIDLKPSSIVNHALFDKAIKSSTELAKALGPDFRGSKFDKVYILEIQQPARVSSEKQPTTDTSQQLAATDATALATGSAQTLAATSSAVEIAAAGGNGVGGFANANSGAGATAAKFGQPRVVGSEGLPNSNENEVAGDNYWPWQESVLPVLPDEEPQTTLVFFQEASPV